MNSYPHEFLAHPQPLMFVAGLTSSKRERSSSQAASSSVDAVTDSPSPVSTSASQARSRSDSAAVAASLEAPSTHSAGALTTPVGSPHVDIKALPASPNTEEMGVTAVQDTEDQEGQGEDDFEALTRNLTEALGRLGRRNKVWLPERERRNFRVMLVDKGIRLPLRKVAPTTSGAQSPSTVPHSPLSPFTPSSPLYPDGLFAPIWVKKHAEMVPAVFVMFLRLYEPPIRSDEADAATVQARKEADRAMEKDADEGLVREITERRKRLGERGIKLTVVLMASAAALDSPSLDARLSYLRRASQLSSKASLFVLSPVPADQLPEFVQSLQDALYDPAAEYYNQHAKRVKRKRSRLPSSSNASATAAPGKGLSPQGWIVRYEWKAGWFAEIRGEVEEARRHYEDCWNELARMFASTQTLPPRTKRWAEAKVLADCVAMRICRLLLYADDGSKVLGPFFIHLKRFGDYSRGWGIGEDTFEFWSWIARQYRIFAELLELGVQAGMRITQITPPIFPSAQSAISPPTLEDLATPISANNPLHVLQSPAFYFYTAALCSVQRQQRFQDALAAEEESLEASVAAGYSATISPGYDNEKKVDHSALIIELYTKAYSLFKEQEYAQNRTALYVAYRIAETYCSSDQHDLAMRFFERISQTFKKDKWSPIVRQIRELWYTCAQKTGHVEHAARLLIEMMSPESGVEGEDRRALQDDLLSLMRTTTPSSTEPIIIASAVDSPIISAIAAYWQAETYIGTESPVQISLTCPDNVFIDNLAFGSMEVVFGGSEGRPDLIIRAGEPADAEKETRMVDVGDMAAHTDGFSLDGQISFKSGTQILIQGFLESKAEVTSNVELIRLHLVQGSWNIRFVVPVVPTATWATDLGVLPIPRASEVKFVTRPYNVKLAIACGETVYVGEQVSVGVSITNDDDRDVTVSILPFLEGSTETDDTSLQLVEAPEKGMHGYDLGIVRAGTSVTKDLDLTARQVGVKRIDVTAHIASVASFSSSQEDVEASSDGVAIDLEQSIDVQALQPFVFTPHVSYGPIKRIEDGNRCTVVVDAMIAASRPSIDVQSIRLEDEQIGHARLIWSSLDHVPYTPGGQDGLPMSESIGARFELSGPADRVSLEAATAVSPAHLEVRWRSDSKHEYTTAILTLPPLSLPTQNTFLSARISHPDTVQNQRPFALTLTIDNSHPSQAMSGLVMQVDMSDSFVWHGERTTRLSTVPPDGSAQVQVVLVPVVSRAGRWELPKVRVWHPQRMQMEREEVRVDGRGVVRVRP